MSSGVLTVAEVSERLRVNHTTVRRLLERGEMDGFCVGHTVRVDATSVAAYLERNRMGPSRKVEAVATGQAG
jgi:excisionase family DNA binding protein